MAAIPSTLLSCFFFVFSPFPQINRHQQRAERALFMQRFPRLAMPGPQQKQQPGAQGSSTLLGAACWPLTTCAP